MRHGSLLLGADAEFLFQTGTSSGAALDTNAGQCHSAAGTRLQIEADLHRGASVE